MRCFQEGFANVKKGEKWGYIDAKGKEYFGELAEEIEKFLEDIKNAKDKDDQENT